VWSNDLDSYASSNIATGRASLAGQVEGDDPNYRDTLVPQVGCLGHEANNSPLLKKILLLRSLIKEAKAVRGP